MEGAGPLMKNYFYFESRPNEPNQYLIRVNFERLPLHYTEGSFNLLPARLLNISYANYCRLCRDECNAIIQGKNSLYPIVIFDSKKSSENLLKLLNQRMEEVIKERNAYGI